MIALAVIMLDELRDRPAEMTFAERDDPDDARALIRATVESRLRELLITTQPFSWERCDVASGARLVFRILRAVELLEAPLLDDGLQMK